jgi:ADP-ribose pyrophosphatase YjhB (NUDIX family)
MESELDSPSDTTGEPGRQVGPWRLTSTREVYRNPWIRVREDQVIRPDGKPGIYGVVELEPAVGIVAVTDDERVYLVGQYRYATESYSWEIVTGFSDRGEDPVAGARRELLEETGLSAESWEPLGHCYLSNCITNQIGYLYLARGLSAGLASPDDTESLAPKTMPLREALGLALEGGIDQAYSIVGLQRAWNRLH